MNSHRKAPLLQHATLEYHVQAMARLDASLLAGDIKDSNYILPTQAYQATIRKLQVQFAILKYFIMSSGESLPIHEALSGIFGSVSIASWMFLLV